MTNTATDARQTTNWKIVFVATLGGVAIALQMGKAAATLPLIRADLGADLSILATYVALISTFGALFGIFVGSVTRAIGAKQSALIGLMLAAAGSLIGGTTTGINILLASRLIEAVGFSVTVTAMPALIQAATTSKDRLLAMGMWTTWLPAGVAVTMIFSFFWLERLGWRGIFMLTAILPAMSALLLWATTREAKGPAKLPENTPFLGVFRTEVVLTTLVFICFSSSNLIIMAFLPTILVDDLNMMVSSAAAIAFVGALALMATNILTGKLLQLGFRRRHLLIVNFVGMAVAAAILLGPSFSVWARIAAAIAFNLFAGVPAAVVWASIPILAKNPGEAPLLSGVFFQGASIGQIIGPMLVALVVGDEGWSRAIWAVGGLAGGGAILSWLLPGTAPPSRD